MNQQQIEGAWKQNKNKVCQKFTQLTDEDLKKVEKSQGKVQELSGILQKKCGLTKVQAEQEIERLLNIKGEKH